MTTTGILPSLAQLRAGLASVQRGDFKGGGTPVALEGYVPVEHGKSLTGRGYAASGGLPARGYTVVSAHSGAGASTTAVLVAEALAASGTASSVVECVEPHRSGMTAVTDSELGVEGQWRRGRRGTVEVFRLADSPDAEAPIVWPAFADEVVLLDLGTLSRGAGPAPAIVVARACVPGIRQTEQFLSRLPGPVPAAVVILGPNRFDRSVRATFGPQLQAVEASGRLVTMPLDRRIATLGLDPTPTPKAVQTAARRVADLLRATSSGAGVTGSTKRKDSPC